MDDKTFEQMADLYKGYDLDTICITKSVEGHYVEKCFSKGPDLLSQFAVVVGLCIAALAVVGWLYDKHR